MPTRRNLLLPLLIACLAASAILLTLVWRNRNAEAPLLDENYSLIEDGLYMGGLVDEPPAGTQAVLNVCRTDDSYRPAAYLWKPIRDAAPAPSIAWLHEAVEFVDTQRRAGRTTYVHCRVGMSRSGMVVIAHLMSRHGWTRDEALKFVRSKRPVTNPNPAFMKLLSEWEQTLKAKTSFEVRRLDAALGGVRARLATGLSRAAFRIRWQNSVRPMNDGFHALPLGSAATSAHAAA